jgi:hypothetical protein
VHQLQLCLTVLRLLPCCQGTGTLPGQLCQACTPSIILIVIKDLWDMQVAGLSIVLCILVLPAGTANATVWWNKRGPVLPAAQLTMRALASVD